MSKELQNGFTLAEVLITLGIIGVVAAMTIPTLMTNINGAKYRNQFKKTLSTFAQAVKMAQAQYDIDFSALNEECTKALTDNIENSQSICALFNAVLKGSWDTTNCNNNSNGYFCGNKYNIEELVSTIHSSEGFMYQFNDGSSIYVSTYSYDCKPTKVCSGFIDVNGPASLPNKIVDCDDSSENEKIGSYDTNKNLTPCVVSNKNITDVYPIIFYNGTIKPASSAAQYVLNNAK